LCLDVEAYLHDAVSTVVVVDAAGMMHPLAAPSVPSEYLSALDGILIGPNVGSCGSAIYRNTRIEVQDIETHLNPGGLQDPGPSLGLSFMHLVSDP
jgi:hypothetical protein